MVACGDSDAPSSPSPTPTPTPPAPPPAPIQTIAESTAGRTSNGGGFPLIVFGQSVTVRNGPFNSLRFSWHRLEGGGTTSVPTASGRLFLLSQEYLGPVPGLSPSVAGFVAVTATVVADEYVFDDATTLQPGSKYWFYTNDQTSLFLASSDHRFDLYPDGDLYERVGPNNFFGISTTLGQRIDANFVLRGRPVSR